MEKPTPSWWKPLRNLTLLGCAAWPFVYFISIFAYDCGTDYYLKRYIVGIVVTYPIWILPLNYLALWIYRKSNSHIAGFGTYLIPIAFILAGCTYYYNGALPTYMYYKDDHRLFWNTPASGLADAIIADDTVMIHEILIQTPELVNYSESCHGQSMLFYAFDRGSFASIRQLIRMGAMVNERNKYGESLLHCLCEGKMPSENSSIYKSMPDTYLRLISWLLEHGADVNMPNTNGFTPLQTLCLHGPDSPIALSLLIEQGAQTDVRRLNHEDLEASPLADAIYFKKLQIATELIQSGVERDSIAARYLEWSKDDNQDWYKVWQIFHR